MTNHIPVWIYVASSVIAVLALFVGISLYVSPGTFIANVNFTLSGSLYLAHMWAARQIAIAGMIAFALFRRSVSMLTGALLGYALMNVQDVCIGISQQDTGLTVGAAIFTLISASMLFSLFRKSN